MPRAFCGVDPEGALQYVAASLTPHLLKVWRRSTFLRSKSPMANNPGAKKAIRKIAARTEVNKARRSRVRTFVRKFEEALTSGDIAQAKAAFVVAQSELMRSVSKGVTHKNTGSRKVSRLAAALKKASVA
jgi:small subunit ribosomal protein S20